MRVDTLAIELCLSREFRKWTRSMCFPFFFLYFIFHKFFSLLSDWQTREKNLAQLKKWAKKHLNQQPWEILRSLGRALNHLIIGPLCPIPYRSYLKNLLSMGNSSSLNQLLLFQKKFLIPRKLFSSPMVISFWNIESYTSYSTHFFFSLRIKSMNTAPDIKY